MRLCQTLAILLGKKTEMQAHITDWNKRLQKPVLFQGISKRYTSKMDNGETFPDENQKVQFRVNDVLAEVRAAMTNIMDLTATQDTTNCQAKADVTVDGTVILPQVPVTHLLWLEKTLTDIQTIIGNIPVLDAQETWAYDPNAGYYTSGTVTTTKTKKVPLVVVKYEATKEHPAQTELLSEDKIIGTWEQKKFSAAMPADEKKVLEGRIKSLLDAVKLAREEANGIAAVDTKVGDKIFDFLFKK
jgi:hypothetical protein